MKQTARAVLFLAAALAPGCTFAPHSVKGTHADIFGIGRVKDEDLTGWAVGLAHFTRIARVPVPGMPYNSLLVKSPAPAGTAAPASLATETVSLCVEFVVLPPVKP